MSELDFSKIFGETATSKASFTDENYLNGWGYLGSTPPPYQLFDYLQGLNDKKSKYLYDGINESKNNLLTHNTDSYAHANIRQMFNNYLTIDETETKLTTHNTDSSAHTPILNAIKAITGTSSYDVAPSKTIAAMIPLLGFGGIVAQRLETDGYVKFANGFTIQWGSKYYGDPSSTFPKVNIDFPVGFQSNPLAIILSEESADNKTNAVFHVSGKTATGFTIISNEWEGIAQKLTANWVAVGV